MNIYIAYISLTLSVFVLLRITVLFVLSYLHDIKLIRLNNRIKNINFTPKVSVIVPAYNEEAGIYPTLDSIYSNDYPNFEVIVISDGSTDRTTDMVHKFMVEKNPHDLVFIEQKNGGKGSALNNGIQNHATGELIMTLDADSILDSKAISNAVKYFTQENVVATAANIKVVDNNKVMSYMQILEYLLAHRYKRAFMLANMDFVIGGPGAVFRKEVLEECGYYETGTITEDLDLTMKIIALGNKKNKIELASDVLVYTEAPAYLKSLHRQRLRWKKGKYQCFKKHKDLFFNRSNKYSKLLTWFFLPYSLAMEFSLFIEPIFVAFMLYYSITNRDTTAVIGTTIFLGFFTLATILSEESISARQKAKLSLIAPFSYIFMYTVMIVEYVGLIRCIKNLRKILFEKEQKGSWIPVERMGIQMKAK